MSFKRRVTKVFWLTAVEEVKGSDATVTYDTMKASIYSLVTVADDC